MMDTGRSTTGRFLKSMRDLSPFFLITLFILFPCSSYATTASLPLLTSTSPAGEVTYHLHIKILFALGLLTILPSLLMTMTAFTRIIIVLSILRQAIGIPNVPSNQILVGLALMMTLYVMMPVFSTIQIKSLAPYLDGKITEQAAIQSGANEVKKFMLKQTRKADLNLFLKLSGHRYSAETDYPLYTIMPAFISSELKTAFQIGFLIFLPFLIIDIVTSSVLMAMGMMMLSPMVISLPFKILFFVMVNGWSLMVTSLVKSFR